MTVRIRSRGYGLFNYRLLSFDIRVILKRNLPPDRLRNGILSY